MRQKGYQFSDFTFKFAIEQQSLTFLKWLRNQGCSWDERVFETALRRQDIEILDWLYNEKCPCANDIISWIDFNHHIPSLDWLRKKGFQWTIKTCMNVRDEELKDWLKANDCPCGGKYH